MRVIARGLGIVSSVFCGLLAILIASEVVSRAATGTSVRGLIEIAELMVVIVIFLGLAQAEFSESHVRVTLITDRLGPRVASAVRGGALILTALFLAWMSWMLLDRAIDSFLIDEFRIGLLRFPLWPSRALAAIGVATLTLSTVVKGVELIRNAAKDTTQAVPDVPGRKVV